MSREYSARLLVLFFLIFLILLNKCFAGESRLKNMQEERIGVAVEFMDHAASAYVAEHKGWYEQAGLNISTYESYVTGMSLASALSRGDIQVAYICLVPAINTYANAETPIKIVSGTHKYGYNLMIDPEKIQDLKDLQRGGLRIGCVREGGSVDVLLNRMIEKYNLKREKVLKNVQRMNPVMQVMALRTASLDAAFIPEHHATATERYGMELLLDSSEVWPQIQGSVLVVRKSLLDEHPGIVQKLVNVTRKATGWIKEHKHEAADIVAKELKAAKGEVFPNRINQAVNKETINSRLMYRSMWNGNRMKYTTSLEPSQVQDMINYLAKLGYIKKSFPAEKILDTTFLEQ